MPDPTIYDRRSAVYETSALDSKFEITAEGSWQQVAGYVRTVDGIVSVWQSAYFATGRGWSYRNATLGVVHGGQQHERRIEGKLYSERFLVTLAKRFAADVVSAVSADA